MTLDKTVRYGTRFGDVNNNSPTGSYKNKTNSSTNDGSFLEQDWANDAYDGLNGAFLANVHDASTGQPQGYTDPFNQDGTVTLNGLVDNAQSSQVYNAWYKKTQDVADGRIAAKQLEEKIAALETLAEGCWFTYYSGGKNAGNVLTNNTTTLEDFNFSSSAAGVSNTVNFNNISVDGNELTFAKSGMYAIKPAFFIKNATKTDDCSFLIQLKKPSDNDFENYINASDITPHSFFQKYGTTENGTTRRGAININNTTIGESFYTYFAFGITQSDFMVAVPEDGTKMKLQTKIVDNDDNAGGFNFQLSLFRVGQYVDTYELPSDIVNVPTPS